MGMTIADKILAKACHKDKVAPGEIVWPEADLVITQDSTLFESVNELRALGATKIKNPEKLMICCDHLCPAIDVMSAGRILKTKEIAKEQGVSNYFPPGRSGISHIMPVEKGYVRPGMFVFSMDTHACTTGAIGALALCTFFEITTVYAIGKLWIRAPESIKAIVEGKLQDGVTARDVATYIYSQIGAEEANYRVLEFVGAAIHSLSIDGRITLCNYAVEVDAKTSIVPPDDVTISFVKSRTSEHFDPVVSDDDADYALVREFDVSTLQPQICIPPRSDVVEPISKLTGTKIDSGYIGSCASGTLEDLRLAAKVLSGNKIHDDCRLLIVPSTQGIFRQALKEGLIDTFIEAGVELSTATCRPCFGSLYQTGNGESRITTATRNEPGRMGSRDATLYLASAATVAASMVKGEIADPREFF